MGPELGRRSDNRLRTLLLELLVGFKKTQLNSCDWGWGC